jgi:chromate reductase
MTPPRPAAPGPLAVLGICGSLRRASYNRAALVAVQELASELAPKVVPGGVTVELADLAGIPPYDEDLRARGLPTAVAALRARIAAADALLIATPEYNHSVPGVLKNAIDWASRPPDQPFDAKPLAILGASPGRTGTARAQAHLRQCFVFLNAHLLNKPEVMIAGANQLVDEAGRLTDQATREHLAKQLAALAAWTRRLQVATGPAPESARP